MSERHYSQERIAVSRAYPGKKWAARVLDMSDQQVHEIWVSLRKRRQEEALREQKTGNFTAATDEKV